mmetsp:Transcript_17879/g.38309  ORF Transcript_17879/g.38309 Transcript_17879/m.38309 type:complete len:246 (-) Transcript_17879:83-820(-)
MGKKRRAEETAAPTEPRQGKKAKSRDIRPVDMTDFELEEREQELSEKLRDARWQREKLRTEPPTANRIAWQREVTRCNNLVHRAESNYNEVKSELSRRRIAAPGGSVAAAAAAAAAAASNSHSSRGSHARAGHSSHSSQPAAHVQPPPAVPVVGHATGLEPHLSAVGHHHHAAAAAAHHLPTVPVTLGAPPPPLLPPGAASSTAAAAAALAGLGLPGLGLPVDPSTGALDASFWQSFQQNGALPS